MPNKGRCACPACGKNLAPKSIHAHTLECVDWKTKYGDPYPYFKFNGTPHQYSDVAQEGIDYVRCRVCLEYGWDFRFKRMMDHLKGVHGLSEAQYLLRFPAALVRLQSTLSKRQGTVQGRFGVSNVFQADVVKAKSKASLLERHGVTSPIQASSVRAKIDATNLARYGVTNPFASSEVKQRIRATNLERFGVENPNQAPEIIQQRIATNQERYGADHYLETPEFKEKFKATSLERYGTVHPMQSPEGRLPCETSMLASLGVTYPFRSDAVQSKAYATSVANHGGQHHLSDPAIIEARKQHLMELYGVDNISKVPAVKERIIAKIKERFRDGAIPRITTPERVFRDLVPERVVYSGDFEYWVTWANGRRKNPDFVVLTEEQYAAYRAGVPLGDLRTYLVVEVNGVWWHTKHKNMTREAREKEFVDGYASVGVSCLVVWEDDLETKPESIQQQVSAFLVQPKVRG